MTDFTKLSWAELEVIEEEGQLLFPVELRKRNKSGQVERRKVTVRVTRPIDFLEARREARAWLEEFKLDIEKDSEILAQMEDLCVLARAIREPLAPHSQFATARELAAYDEGSLRDIKERLNFFRDMVDPRESIRTDEEFWDVVSQVQEKRNLLPLADIAGHELPSFIMRLVWEASKSRTEQSSPPSSETSTPAT